MTQPMFVAFVGAGLTRNHLTKGVWCGERPGYFPKEIADGIPPVY